jgi:hypothetical protein
MTEPLRPLDLERMRARLHPGNPSTLSLNLEAEEISGVAQQPNYTHVEIDQKGQPGYLEGLFGDGVFYEGALVEMQGQTRFYPGTWHGSRFVPGIPVRTNAGETFLPGMYYQGAFVPGVTTSTAFGHGSDSFLPGLVMDTSRSPGKAMFASIEPYLSGGIKGTFGYAAGQGASIFVVGTYDGQRRFNAGVPNHYQSRDGTTAQGGFPMEKVGNKLAQVSDVCGGNGFTKVIPGRGSMESSYAGTQVQCTPPAPEVDVLARFAQGCGVGGVSGGLLGTSVTPGVGTAIGAAIGCIVLGTTAVVVSESAAPDPKTYSCTITQTNADGKTVKEKKIEVKAPNEVQTNKDGSVDVLVKEQGDFTQSVMPPNPAEPCPGQQTSEPSNQNQQNQTPPATGTPSETGSDVAVPGWLMSFLSDWNLLPTGSGLRTSNSGVIDYGDESQQTGTPFRTSAPGDIDPGNESTGHPTLHPDPLGGLILTDEDHGGVQRVGSEAVEMGGRISGGPVGTGQGVLGQGGMAGANEYRSWRLTQIDQQARAGSYTIEQYNQRVDELCRAEGITPPPRKTLLNIMDP